MAKKKTQARRVPRSASPRTYSDGKIAQPATVERPETLPTTSGPSQPRVRSLQERRPMMARPGEGRMVPLPEEYHYVLGDLRRLGILAAGTAVIMLILGLVIR